MALQVDTGIRSDLGATLAGYFNGGGVTQVVKLFSGALPANCAAVDPSGELADGALPTNALDDADLDGVVTMTNTWTATGSAAGTAACFRVYDSSGNCGMQGNVTATGGGGVMEIDNTSIAVGQVVVVTAITITIGGA